MSVSSYSSCISSSSSSSSSSSGSTGSFSSSSSSGASFSSRSTIVAPQAVARPFGYPEYNYFWIENRSKANPKKSYFYNYKSHAVVWDRPLPNDVPLPFYTSAWEPGPKEILDKEDDLVVSEEENPRQRKKRLSIKQRNRRLLLEDANNELQVYSVKKTIKSKKSLDVLWKLYRLPGESVRDVKKRLLDSMENTAVRIKKERIDMGYENNISGMQIKQEPTDFIDYSNEIEKLEENLKKVEDDSDYDEDNVSALIKQEYMMNFQDSEDELRDEGETNQQQTNGLERDSEDLESEEESGESEESEELTVEQNEEYNIEPEIIEPDGLDDFDESYEETYPLADLFELEIKESDKQNDTLDLYNALALIESSEEDVNWTFEKSSEPTNDSGLTQLALNPFHVPKLKKITQKSFITNKIKKKRLQKKKAGSKAVKKVPKIIIKKEPTYHVEQKLNDSDEGPIICDRYGTRTVNYNHPPKIKVPKWQSCDRLSDSEDSAAEFEAFKDKQKVVNPMVQPSKIKLEQEGPLELRNWFPKRKTAKKKRGSGNKSESSWCESNLSDYSEIDEKDITLVRMKKEKKTSSDEERVNQADNEDEDRDEVYFDASDKFSSIPIERKKDEVPLTPAVDLGLVKVERRSSEERDVDYINSLFEQSFDKNFVQETFNQSLENCLLESLIQNTSEQPMENGFVDQEMKNDLDVKPIKNNLNGPLENCFVEQPIENDFNGPSKSYFLEQPMENNTIEQPLENVTVEQPLAQLLQKVVEADSDSDSSSSSSSSCSRSSCSGCRSSSSSCDEKDAVKKELKTEPSNI